MVAIQQQGGDIEKEQKKKILGKIVNISFPVIFIIALIIEMVALYTTKYEYRFYGRTLLVPMLCLKIFKKDTVLTIHFFLYLSIIFTWFGDILYIIPEKRVQYLGSSLYTASYIAFGYVFYNFREKKNMLIAYFFYTLLIADIVVSFCFFYFPRYENDVAILHLVLHTVVMLNNLIWAFLLIKNQFRKMAVRYFIPSAIFMLASNIFLGYDLYYFNNGPFEPRIETWPDLVVCALFTLYMILFTLGVNALNNYIPKVNTHTYGEYEEDQLEKGDD